ncbi:MAG: DUF4147 domain-containing protein [Leptonema sp. (in: Bacteria)]|nr:DUF4147 domain-containing protein [Leptonema sp. (in: bacteria)]
MENQSIRNHILEIYKAAVEASLPHQNVETALADAEIYRRIQSSNRLHIVSIGKAGYSMLLGAVAGLQSISKKVDSAVLVIPDKPVDLTVFNEVLPTLKVYYGGHPLPNQDSITAAETVVESFRQFDQSDFVLLLISGGGSALFELPEPNLSLDELRSWYSQLIDSGKPISEINQLRQSRSLVKGGKLALATKAQIVQLLLSDVADDNPSIIASGPAWLVDSTNRVLTRIVGSANIALQSAKLKSEQLGYQTLTLSSSQEGDSSDIGRYYSKLAKSVSLLKRQSSIAVISCGETTVAVTPNSGKGGRNMHLALSAAIELAGDYQSICIASLGTDGRDGPTDAAGAIIDCNTVNRIKNHGLHAFEHLANFDSYTALLASNDLVKVGLTGTNVGDIMIVLIQK